MRLKYIYVRYMKPGRRKQLVTPTRVLGVIAATALLLAVLKYATRTPSDTWFEEYLRNDLVVANMWVPGIGTRDGQSQAQVERYVREKQLSGKCKVAFFPYASVSLPLDLVAAFFDKLKYASFRPQVVNIVRAIRAFLAKFTRLRIVAYSHGALLVKYALMELACTADGNGKRISVYAFGPAELVPQSCPQYAVSACLNWVLVDDVLPKYGILDLPEQLVTPENIRQNTIHTFEWGTGTYSVHLSDSKNSDASAFQVHCLYPFWAGLDCTDAKDGPGVGTMHAEGLYYQKDYRLRKRRAEAG